MIFGFSFVTTFVGSGVGVAEGVGIGVVVGVTSLFPEGVNIDGSTTSPFQLHLQFRLQPLHYKKLVCRYLY